MPEEILWAVVWSAALLALAAAASLVVLGLAVLMGRSRDLRRRTVEAVVISCLEGGPRYSHALAHDVVETLRAVAGRAGGPSDVSACAERLRLGGVLVWSEPGFRGPGGGERIDEVRRLYRLTPAGHRRARRLAQAQDPTLAVSPVPAGRRESALVPPGGDRKA